MNYGIITLLLFLFEILYFKIANKYNIIDKPNERSSHKTPTLRGGGVIFWFVALFYFVQHPQENYPFFIGITLISWLSFWDDIQSLSNKIRILAHFIAISLVFHQLNLFQILPVWGVIAAYIVFVGIINAYNFMDGINGITGLYSLVVLGSLFFANQNVAPFVDADFIVYPMLAAVVFLFFNFRKKAKCFAGDVGSIAIAFWIIFLLLKLVLATESLVWILFLAVYGVDSVLTILHRLYLKQNIFEAHRMHFYQILCNQYKMDHRIVASAYAVFQMIISGVIIYFYDKIGIVLLFFVVLLPLVLIYQIKFYLIKKILRNS